MFNYWTFRLQVESNFFDAYEKLLATYCHFEMFHRDMIVLVNFHEIILKNRVFTNVQPSL